MGRWEHLRTYDLLWSWRMLINQIWRQWACRWGRNTDKSDKNRDGRRNHYDTNLHFLKFRYVPQDSRLLTAVCAHVSWQCEVCLECYSRGRILYGSLSERIERKVTKRWDAVESKVTQSCSSRLCICNYSFWRGHSKKGKRLESINSHEWRTIECTSWLQLLWKSKWDGMKFHDVAHIRKCDSAPHHPIILPRSMSQHRMMVARHIIFLTEPSLELSEAPRWVLVLKHHPRPADVFVKQSGKEYCY